MAPELLPLVNELCFLAATRNAINTRRHRARFRKNYYAHALRVVEAHKVSSAELRHLEIHNSNGKYQAKIDSIKSNMAWLRQRHPKPVKWQSMGLYKLRSLILQGEAEYAMAKHETMEFSIKHRARVKYLVSMLNCSLRYDNGTLKNISFRDSVTPSLGLEDIHRHAEQYELNRAIENIVEE